MVYAVGIVGFVLGFALGLVLLSRWLRDKSRRELMTNRDLQYRYGLFNWMLAGLGCYVAVKLYQLALVTWP
jgi:putative copper export protein